MIKNGAEPVQGGTENRVTVTKKESSLNSHSDFGMSSLLRRATTGSSSLSNTFTAKTTVPLHAAVPLDLLSSFLCLY